MVQPSHSSEVQSSEATSSTPSSNKQLKSTAVCRMSPGQTEKKAAHYKQRLHREYEILQKDKRKLTKKGKAVS